jgi:hypothetical protein
MLHLLPIRSLIAAIIACVAIAIIASVYAGWVGTDGAVRDARWALRGAGTAATVVIVFAYAAWRWIPPVQQFIFPYLGGQWSGELHFSGPNGSGVRPITLTVDHTLFGIKLILDSAESTSRTLVVHAERDVGVNRNRLYYVYLNERKEGLPGARDRYRGLAILRLEPKTRPELYGDYFTEKKHSGQLQLRRSTPHPFWMLWK